MQRITLADLDFSKPIHLDALTVAKLTVEAIDNRTIQAAVDPGGCVYYNPEFKCQCAVGQAFTPEAAEAFQNHLCTADIDGDTTIESLFECGVVSSDNPHMLSRLQIKHDNIGTHSTLQDLRDLASEFIAKLESEKEPA